MYNRIYYHRGYVRPEDGGAAAEHEALTQDVTVWNVAVERQIRVKGPDAERFSDYVITRHATRIEPMHAKYVIVCDEKGGILNDPVLLRHELSDSHVVVIAQLTGFGGRIPAD